jgi:hypothetical protein
MHMATSPTKSSLGGPVTVSSQGKAQAETHPHPPTLPLSPLSLSLSPAAAAADAIKTKHSARNEATKLPAELNLVQILKF